ncbi:MAG: MFS transporter [Planctomycetaceae bacterium]
MHRNHRTWVSTGTCCFAGLFWASLRLDTGPAALLTVRAILGKESDGSVGSLQSGASLGAILVPVYIGITESWGKTWEFPFWSIGIAGLCWIPAWFVLIRGRNLMQIKSDVQSNAAAGLPAGGNQSMAGNRLVRCVICLAIMIGSLNISWQFLRAWIIKFLVEFHGYTDTQSRVVNVVYFIAADVGCLLSGALMTALLMRNWKKQNARLLGFFLFSLLTICGAAIPYVQPGILMMVLLCITGAGILGLHPFYYSLAQELSARHMGSLSGLLAAFGWVCSGRAQELIGREIEATGSYERGLLMAGLAPLIGFASLAFLWPNDEQVEPTAATSP